MILALSLFVIALVAVFFLGRWSVLAKQRAIAMTVAEIKLRQLAKEVKPIHMGPGELPQLETHRERNLRRYAPPQPTGIPNPQFRAAWAQAELDNVKEDYSSGIE